MSEILKEGYHGTTKINKENILKEQKFHFDKFDVRVGSNRIPNDLGAGVYFFCDDTDIESKGFDMAYEYTKKYKENSIRKQNSSIEVIKTNIECKKENFLDLDEEINHIDFIKMQKKFSHQAEMLLKRAKDDRAKKRDNRDGIFVELLVEKLKKQSVDVKVISKRTFTPLKQKQSNFPNGLELCVRNTELITIN